MTSSLKFRRSLNGVTDGGFLFVRSDYPDPSSLYDLVPEYEAAQPLSEAVCEAVIGCGVPVYTRKLETTAHAGGRWLSAEPPANMISNPVELQMSVSPALSGLISGRKGSCFLTRVFQKFICCISIEHCD